MDRNEYNIDEILSEVKKRKEEENLKNETPAQPEPEPGDSSAENEPVFESAEENHLGDTADLPEIEPQQQSEKPNENESALPGEQGGAQLPGSESESRPDEGMLNIMDFAGVDEAPQNEEPQPESTAKRGRKNKKATSAENAAVPETDEEPAQGKKGKKGKKKKPWSKTRKILTSIIVILLALIVAAAGVFAFTANDWLNDIINNSKSDSGNTASTEEWKGMDKLEENFDPIEETEATELSSLEDMVQSWYYNGSPCSSTHVLNVLLVGEDTRGSKILDEGTRADSAIIASVNIDTKTITLTSILRDSWAYWETEDGKKSSGRYGKINGAMSTGDIECYKRTIENLYKVNLDGHAIVNFDSFESIVDALGGVTLELTDAEINEINNHPKRYGHVTIKKKFSGTKGKQKLNGKQALAYCRIRHIDSDGARADRQKTCLIEIFNETKDASTTKLIKVVRSLIPYIKTSFSKNEIIKIASYAFSNDWLDYDTVMTNVPEMNVKGGSFKPDFGGQWVWKADFPADAYVVQKRIYGKSNITLAHVRVDVKTVRQSGIFADGAYATTSTYTNDNYGEESTIPTTTKKEKSTTKAAQTSAAE